VEQLDYSNGYEVSTHEVGIRVTCFCPVCKAQVFGSLHSGNLDDLITHMNSMHPTHRPGNA